MHGSRGTPLPLRSVVLALMLALPLGACDAITEVGRELAVSLSTDRQNIRAGQSFEIRYVATGSALVQLLIDPGDGSSQELVDLFGSQTADGHVDHTYAEAGTYEVSAIASEFDGRRRTARMTLVIAP
jgi:hypothetical protein